jgi:hypothetical protein
MTLQLPTAPAPSIGRNWSELLVLDARESAAGAGAEIYRLVGRERDAGDEVRPHTLCEAADLRVLRASLAIHGYRHVMGELDGAESFGVEIWIHDPGDTQ